MKQTKLWQCIILFTAVAFILSVTPQLGTAQKMSGPKIEWGKDIKIEASDKLTSFELNHKALGRSDFFGFSNKVLQKLTGKDIKIKENDIGADDKMMAWIDKGDPSSLILQDAFNGNISFSNRMTEFVSMEKVSLPEQGQAQELAMNFIKEMELLPADFSTNGQLLHVGGLFSQDLENDRLSEISQKLITFHFGRELNGIPVMGGGSKLIVEVGHQGAIVSLNKKWSPVKLKMLELQPLKPGIRVMDPGKFQVRPEGQTTPWVPAIKLDPTHREIVKLPPNFSPDEVKNLINRTLPTVWGNCDRILINNVRLVYYDRSANFIQPAYAIEMTVFTGKETFEDLYFVSALRTAPEPIYPISFAEMPKLMDEQQKPAEFEEAFE
jgi:hypothetical protein